MNDLSDYTADELPDSTQGPVPLWPQRFQEIIAQGYKGKWLNVSRAYGLGVGKSGIRNAATRWGWDVTLVQRDGELWMRVNKAPAKGSR